MRQGIAVLLLAVGSLGCHGPGPVGPKASPVGAPEAWLAEGLAGRARVVPAGDQAPLSAWLEVDAQAELEVRCQGPDGTYRVHRPAAQSPHRVLLPSLQPGGRYQLSIELRAGDSLWSAGLDLRARAAGIELPSLTVLGEDPRPGPPGILFNLMQEEHYERGTLVVVDGRGALRWLFCAPKKITDARLLPNGQILCLVGKDEAWQIDLAGQPVRRWHAAGLLDDAPPESVPVACDTFHHELLPLSDSCWTVLSTELVRLDYPTSEIDPASPRIPTWVVGDSIVEFNPTTGAVLRRWSLLELLDPQRLGYLSLSGLYNGAYGRRTADWSHGNALLFDARDDSYIVSLRHQDALVKLSRQSGQLRWILGDPQGWQEPWQELLLEAPDDFLWPFHQHAPSFGPDGQLLLFDNGNFRALPFDPPKQATESFSRAVLLDIDENAGRVAQTWSYRGSAPFYSPWLGDADWLPERGSVLITDGGRTLDAEGTPSNDVRAGHHFGRILEVAFPTGALLFELQVGDPRPDTTRWAVYRAEAVGDLWTLAGWQRADDP